ncbi:unnamed protein product [Chrysoparadoxa australica]
MQADSPPEPRPFMRRKWKDRLAMVDAKERRLDMQTTVGVEDFLQKHIATVSELIRDSANNALLVTQALGALVRHVTEPKGLRVCKEAGVLGACLVAMAGLESDAEVIDLGTQILVCFGRANETRSLIRGNQQVTAQCVSQLRGKPSQELVQRTVEVLALSLEGSTKSLHTALNLECATSIVSVLHRYITVPPVVRDSLAILRMLCMVERGKKEVLHQNTTAAALQCMQRFQEDEQVAIAALRLLLVVCDEERSRNKLVKTGGLRIVLDTMKAVLRQEELQARGAEMIYRLVTENEQAWHELDSIKGGWQWLCQGTLPGNKIIKFAPGKFHVEGWTCSEVERISPVDAARAAKAYSTCWTSLRLKRFIGSSPITDSKLCEEDEIYFDVITELVLLPYAAEERLDWFARLTRYEKAHSVTIKEIAVERAHQMHK